MSAITRPSAGKGIHIKYIRYVTWLIHSDMTRLGADVGASERWGAGVETQKNVRGEIGKWGRVPFDEPYAPSLSDIYDGA